VRPRPIDGSGGAFPDVLATRLYSHVMPDRSRKNPRDLNALASAIVDEVTSDEEQKPKEPTKDPAAVELGRRGGLKGGPARAAKLSAKKRSEIAKKAAEARWRSRTS
jgi:hypothetical protein